MLSILTTTFNEAANLPALYDRLVETMRGIGGDWEWVIVDDHSRDETFAVIEALTPRDVRLRGLRLARNPGSHVAIPCGIHPVAGAAVAEDQAGGRLDHVVLGFSDPPVHVRRARAAGDRVRPSDRLPCAAPAARRRRVVPAVSDRRTCRIAARRGRYRRRICLAGARRVTAPPGLPD